jgi:hypothetical protein
MGGGTCYFSSLVTVSLGSAGWGMGLAISLVLLPSLWVLQDGGVGRAISLVLLPSFWVLQDGDGTRHFSNLLTVS